MINCRGISNRGKIKTISKPCEIYGSFRMGCEISHTLRTNFAHFAKINQPCEIILNTLRNFRKAYEKFRIPNTISHNV